MDGMNVCTFKAFVSDQGDLEDIGSQEERDQLARYEDLS